MKASRFNLLLSNFHVALSIGGYALVTSLFSDDMGGEAGSRAVTVPFRALCLGVSLWVLYLNRGQSVRLRTVSKVAFWYISLLLLRFFWDTNFGLGTHADPSQVMQYWLYMIGLTLVPCMALVRSMHLLRFDKLLVMFFAVFALATALTYLFNDSFQTATEERLEGNTALGSIAAGHLGLTAIILSVAVFRHFPRQRLLRLAALVVTGVGVLVWLRAGSRGPVLAAIVITAGWLLVRSLRSPRSFILSLVLLVLLALSLNFLIAEMRFISPALYNRLFERGDSQTSDRDALFLYAWEAFKRSPLIGESLGMYIGSGIHYPHNIFLDSLMQWGVVGFSMITYMVACSLRRVIALVRHNSAIVWLGILWTQEFLMLCVSGTMAIDPKFWILMVLLAQTTTQIQDNKHNT